MKHFTDYRAFLLAHIQTKKQQNRKWTMGVWARQLDLKSTSSISKVVSGERLPGKGISEKLVQYFQFTADDEQYFKDLIRFHKVKKDPQLAVAILEKIGKDHPDGSLQILDGDSFQVISTWYSLAIREMMRTDYFVKDPSWISQQFRFKINPQDVSKAILCMQKAGIIHLNSSEEYEVVSSRLKSGDDVSNEAIKRYHESMLDRAKESVRKFGVQEREFQASTLLMNPKNLDAAKQCIREFQEKFARLFEEPNGSQVFQIQSQLFPLTKKMNRGEK